MPVDWRKTPDEGAPTVISLFAGCGGSSLGYRLAGFRELLAIDFDKHACECFKLNFKDIPCWQRDIKKITAREILEFCNLEKGGFDVLDGSPPCQGFSTAGKRKVLDPRNDLFMEYVRMIKELEPKVFIMENVSGMVKGRMKGRFKEIILKLKSLPYRVECRKLNAMWYGVPQSRERIFVIGISNQLNKKPAWPTHTVERPISVKKAFEGYSDYFDKKNDWNGCYSDKRYVDHILSEKRPCPTVTRIGRMFIKLKESHSPRVLEAWHASKPGQLLRKARKYVGSYQSCRLDSDKPSMTCIKAHRHWHYAEPRQLTDNEIKILCSYPIDFELIGTRQKRAAVLGNSVMPLQMKAIAETVRNEILCPKTEVK